LIKSPQAVKSLISRKKAEKLCKFLKGYKTYLVGGCVRDELLGLYPKDYDIVTDAKPEEIKKVFSNFKILEVGKAFGIITVIVEGEPFEIATMRLDNESDGRRPESVTFISSIYDDLARRDFTINGIAYDPINKLLIDPFEGISDLKNKLIRFIGIPSDRIEEDQLRILRAFRFVSTHSLSLEKVTHSELNYAVSNPNCFSKVSQERITSEFIRIINGDNAVTALEELINNKLLFKIIPELERQLEPHNSPKWHNETYNDWGKIILSHTMNVFKHSVELTLNISYDDKFILRTATLLHDIGKPFCREDRGDHDRFLGHDIVGAEIALKRLRAMKLKSDYIKPIVSCIKNHMNCHNLLKMHDVAKIRKFLGKKYFKYIYNIAIFDSLGTLNENSPEPEVSNLNNKILNLNLKYPTMLPEKIITGSTLIEAGLNPSEAFKFAIDKAYDQQLRGETDERKLLNFAKGIYTQWKPKSKES
jgi:putative nucleotidyltransferase with HDIG domain